MIYPLEVNSKKEIDWTASARSHDNYRLSRSLIVTTQIVSAILIEHGFKTKVKPISHNHPLYLWTVESSANVNNIFCFGDGLFNEFYLRFNKDHKSGKLLQEMRRDINLIKFEDNGNTSFPLAMPDEFKTSDIVQSYRNFWVSKEKMRYPKKKVPDWFLKMRKIPYEITL